MIEEHGVIVACEGAYAIVETQRQTACGGCRLKAGCGTTALHKLWGQKRTQVKVMNAHRATVGQTVVIGLDERALVRGSFSFYGIPLFAMLVGALSGHAVELAAASGGELWSIAGGLLGFALATVWLRHHAEKPAFRSGFQPVILRVVADA